MPARPSAPSPDDGPGFWGEDGFTFDDVLDLINPLHHIPLVSTVYRDLTGDEIAPGPKILGAGLFSLGPIGAGIGMASAAVDSAIERNTGRDIGSHVMALLGEDETTLSEAENRLTADTPSAAPAPDMQMAAATTNGVPAQTPDGAERRPIIPEPIAMSALSSPEIPKPRNAPPVPETDAPDLRDTAHPQTHHATAKPSSEATAPILSNDQWAALVQQLPPDLTPGTQSSQDRKKEDIAAKMNDALDKYAAMMRAQRPTGAVSEAN